MRLRTHCDLATTVLVCAGGCPAEDAVVAEPAGSTTDRGTTSAGTPDDNSGGATLTSTLPGSTGSSSTTSDTTGTADCSDPPASGPISDACALYATALETCYPDWPQGCADYWAAYCQRYLDEIDGACLFAYEDLYACLAAVDCKAIDDPQACADEIATIDAACAGGTTGGGV